MNVLHELAGLVQQPRGQHRLVLAATHENGCGVVQRRAVTEGDIAENADHEVA